MRRSLMLFLVFSPIFAVFGLTAARAYAERLPWENLPFSFSSLVQDGTENLLSNANFQDGLEGWNAKGDVLVEGNNVLRLGPKRDGKKAFIQQGLSVSSACVYQLSFRFHFTSGVKFDYQGSYPGLHGWFVPRGSDGQTSGAVRILEQRQLPKGDPEDPGIWLKYHARLLVPANVDQLSFSVEFNAIAGNALLTGFDLREEKVEANEGRQILVTDTHNHAELPRHRESGPPSEVTVFHRSDVANGRESVIAAADPPVIFRKSRLLSSLSMLSMLYLGSAEKQNDVVYLLMMVFTYMSYLATFLSEFRLAAESPQSIPYRCLVLQRYV